MTTTGDRALVLGLGRFGGGREAARYLLRHGWRVRVCDRRTEAELTESVHTLRSSVRPELAADIEWRLGEESTALLDGVGLVVVNPAVPPHHPLLQAAVQRAIPLTQEVALFLQGYPGRVVMVTGTNGKSSTCDLLAAVLRRAGSDVLLGGNIGHSLLADESRWSRDQIAVLEASSFQLQRLAANPQQVHGAVITRVGQDHLDYHGTLHAYHAAKAVAAASATDFLVHAADDPVAAGFATPARQRVRFALQGPADVTCARDWVITGLGADPGTLLHRHAIKLLGDFQLENVMAASAAAAMLGVPRHESAFALANGECLPYRLQLLGEHGGVRLYDNSVSTELESTLVALQTVAGPLHWVGGGKSKDKDFRRVAEAVAPYLVSAHLFGAAGVPLARWLRSHVPVTVGHRLEDALSAAWRTARPGHAVVVSPAFSSFDQYPNFRARADEFHRWARQVGHRSPGVESNPSAGAIGPQLASH